MRLDLQLQQVNGLTTRQYHNEFDPSTIMFDYGINLSVTKGVTDIQIVNTEVLPDGTGVVFEDITLLALKQLRDELAETLGDIDHILVERRLSRLTPQDNTQQHRDLQEERNERIQGSRFRRSRHFVQGNE